MIAMNQNSAIRSEIDAEVSPKLKYQTPELRVVGSAVMLVQGCGGGAGQDRNYYRIFC